MRRLILPLLCCCLLLAGPVTAQTAPAQQPAPEDDTQEPSEADTFPEIPADDAPSETADDQENADQSQGETSWEQLNAEREPEVTPSPAEEPPETFSPLVLWRMIRGLWSKD